MNKKLFLFLILLIEILGFGNTASFGNSTVLAYDMKLLAVSEQNGILTGSTADLSLEIKQGSGRVFMDTFPFTKLDTQMSTHFAKEIACNLIGIDCSKYDFFYTIHSNSAIIGGPSAGAAMTFLTIAKLEKKKIPKNFSITGTINIGGIIGRVGGVKEKIEAASRNKIKIVFIPKGERFLSEEKNASSNNLNKSSLFNLTVQNKSKKIDLVEYGKKLGVKVIETSSVNDILCYFYNERCIDKIADVNANPDYSQVMLNIGINLCNRTNNLIKKINNPELEKALRNNIVNYSLDIDISALVDLMIKRRLAFQYKNYYSMASFCFSENLILQDYLKQKLAKKEVESELKKIKISLEFFKKQLAHKKIETMTDLQTYIITKERLYETEDYLDAVKNSSNINDTKKILAYATERLYSASMWSDFFGKGKNYFYLDQENLKEGCLNKIYEAEERVEYIKLYFPALAKSAEKSIMIANKEYLNKDYAFCLFKASKAKAEIDAMLSTFSATEDTIDSLLEDKKKIVSNLIKTQQDKGLFPILGYSYYEYAQSLSSSDKLNDKISALLYYDYATEFSNLDLYFKPKSKEKIKIKLNPAIYLYSINVLVFCLGVITGFIFNLSSKKRRKTKKTEKFLNKSLKKVKRK